MVVMDRFDLDDPLFEGMGGRNDRRRSRHRRAKRSENPRPRQTRSMKSPSLGAALPGRRLLGVVLIAASVGLGAYVVKAADQRILLPVAAVDLGVGHVLTAADFRWEPVALGEASTLYLDEVNLGIGQVVGHAISRGGLIPLTALGVAEGQNRILTIPVPSQHLPANVTRGSLVDVWAIPQRDAALPATTVARRVLERVYVEGIDSDSRTLSPNGSVGISLLVHQELIGEILSAGESGALFLVQRP
jgi:hypothetical protein